MVSEEDARITLESELRAFIDLVSLTHHGTRPGADQETSAALFGPLLAEIDKGVEVVVDQETGALMEVDVTRMVEAHIMVAGMLVSIAGEQGDLQAVDVIDRLRRQLLQERC